MSAIPKPSGHKYRRYSSRAAALIIAIAQKQVQMVLAGAQEVIMDEPIQFDPQTLSTALRQID
jgi:hypothetical protein